MSFILSNLSEVNEYIKKSFTPYYETNKEKLAEILTNIEDNWLVILFFLNNVDSMLQKFSSVHEDLYCQCFPKRTKQLTYKRLNNPWLTSHFSQYIKLKSEYFKQCRRGLMSKATNTKFRILINKQLLGANRNTTKKFSQIAERMCEKAEKQKSIYLESKSFKQKFKKW